MSATLPMVRESAHYAAPSPAFTFQDMEAMAYSIAKSGLLPGVHTPEAALALILLCQSEGLHPGAALRRYHIVEGRPTMRADAMQAEFQARGGVIRWIERTAARCAAEFSHPAHCPEPLLIEVTFAEMDKLGITKAKEGLKKNWRQWPRQMLHARCVSEGVRAVMPGVVAGIYTPEEASDFDPAPRAVTVEPTAVRNALPNPERPKSPRERWEAWLGKLLRRWAEAEPYPASDADRAAAIVARENRIAQGLISDALARGLVTEEQISRPNAKGKPARDARAVWEAVHQLVDADWEFVRAATLEHLAKHVRGTAEEEDMPDGDPEFADDGKGKGDAWEPEEAKA